ncbi:hypothetical protein K0H71_10180 [Bacillus sp. IITD106]|nr:hypothetical protein [Bacillus sp. IITD106]
MIDLIIQKLNKIEDKLNEHTNILNNHSEILTSHTEMLTSHSQILKNHDEQLKSHGDLLHQLIKNVAATNAKLNELSGKVDKNTKDIETIKSTMVTTVDLQYFDREISEHDREIMKMKLG